MVNFGDMLTAIDSSTTTSYATSVNSSGQVVGYFNDATGMKAFLYSGGTMTSLFAVTNVSNITDNGMLAGTFQVVKDSIAYSDGFSYNVNNTSSFTDLGGISGTPGNVRRLRRQ